MCIVKCIYIYIQTRYVSKCLCVCVRVFVTTKSKQRKPPLNGREIPNQFGIMSLSFPSPCQPISIGCAAILILGSLCFSGISHGLTCSLRPTTVHCLHGQKQTASVDNVLSQSRRAWEIYRTISPTRVWKKRIAKHHSFH